MAAFNSTTTQKPSAEEITPTLVASSVLVAVELPDKLAEANSTSALLLAIATDKHWQSFNIRNASTDELREYKHYLELQLVNVTQLLDESDKNTKRFISLPVSSSLPDHVSSDFVLRRFIASTAQDKISKSKPDEERKQSAEVTKIENADVDTASEQPSLQVDRKPSEEGKQQNKNDGTLETELGITHEETSAANRPAKSDIANSTTKQHRKAFGVQTTHLINSQSGDDEEPAARHSLFEPIQNHTLDECKRLTQAELVSELKQKGSYNPNLMAWDVAGVFRFLDRSIVDQYERQMKSHKSNRQTVLRNIEALERILTELNLRCDVRAPEVLSRLHNLTISEPRRTVMSPSIRLSEEDIRFKRHTLAEDLLRPFNQSRLKDDLPSQPAKSKKTIGDVHVVPFGCDKRGEEEDGYLRLCGACQAIRKLPDSFFPPFINEVVCDEDRACLYFYDYPHGKCKQKHMNFVVLRNVGTPQCQVWQKFNLNVRVSCECFVDELSFFAKYV